MEFQEFTEDEKLALASYATQIFGKVEKEIKDAQKRDLLEAFDEQGIDRRRIRVGGSEVGQVYVTKSKATVTFVNGFEDEALAYLLENGLAEVKPTTGWQAHFDSPADGVVVNKLTGEEVPYLRSVRAGESYGATVRMAKPDVIREAFAGRMIGGIMADEFMALPVAMEV